MEDATYPLPQARDELARLVSRVRHGHEHVVITEDGSPAAALIPVGELGELRRLRDEADIAEAERRRNDPGAVGMTHESFMAELEAEDLRGRTAAW